MTRYLQGNSFLHRRTPSIAGYGGYAETTDVWSTQTNNIMHLTIPGPGNFTVKSYGGRASIRQNGGSASTLDGLASSGQAQTFQTADRWNFIEIYNPIDNGPSYAFAYIDVPDVVTPGTLYVRGSSFLNELTPDISNYGGYSDATDVWTAGTKTLISFTANRSSWLVFRAYGGNATVKFDGSAVLTLNSIISGVNSVGIHVAQLVTGASSTVAVTVVDPSDNVNSFAFAYLIYDDLTNGPKRLYGGL